MEQEMSPGTDIAAAVAIEAVSYRYGDRLALDGVSLSISPGEMFALLGPNGGGKTTLFRLLATLAPLQSGRVSIFGHTLPAEMQRVRELLGVVFQAASLDKKLTVEENLWHQGRLYGLTSAALRTKIGELLARLRLADRARSMVETLSGGLKRRVEIAKALLHDPRLLLLDEPSTGLDPIARSELWQTLSTLRDEHGVTVVLTTHLLDEAEKADRLAILNAGKLVALDTPARLRDTVGGDSITIETDEPGALAAQVTERFAIPAAVFDESVRIEQAAGHQWIARLVEAFPGQVKAIRLGKPTLEDVFIDRCGRRL
jgi:ABC-2 type transport system ATP-binding protein